MHHLNTKITVPYFTLYIRNLPHKFHLYLIIVVYFDQQKGVCIMLIGNILICPFSCHFDAQNKTKMC